MFEMHSFCVYLIHFRLYEARTPTGPDCKAALSLPGAWDICLALAWQSRMLAPRSNCTLSQALSASPSAQSLTLGDIIQLEINMAGLRLEKQLPGICPSLAFSSC